ncbi:Nucleotidyltransferase substrate binding domain protein [Corynebacterium kutscheri]|uniref:Putative nucleotidyltransferase substrate binding domain n=1 Tax=Corynebacterium kutscheri TaxID=35755 RepID=A0A0F6R1H4_9CORY|nr:Putative nucleotidyltransferase substrate binding domain [Corynebacterium kutscheri]VEH10178.1 Nucleotidyltransferase substrate binding domain protein [Corynebacterium kutscheri]VEH80260.1 Nucleotidyltransferase substrate binding domain protein [Corynebacterium kutscheri]
MAVINVLHSSLVELAEQAPLCADIPTVRGVLAESQELLRNATNHNADAHELLSWFSALVSDVLHSPGVQELTGGAQLIVTGAVGRGDALPTSPIRWLTVGENTDTSRLSELIARVGLTPDKTAFGVRARTQDQWRSMIQQASKWELTLFADAGTWYLEEVLALDSYTPLLIDALTHRPPALQTLDGLPDREVSIDVRRDLLYPIIALARWAGAAAQSTAVSTLARINAGEQAAILSSDQADLLREAWHAGITLQFRRWADKVHTQNAQAEDLPAIQRSVFGASSRNVSLVLRSIAASYNVALPKEIPTTVPGD